MSERTSTKKTNKQAHHPIDLQMTFGDHLEELRRCIILALVGMVVALILMFFIGKQLVGWIHLPLAQAQRHVGISPHAFHSAPISGFTIYLKVCLVASLIVSAPWIFIQFWRFVSVGLYARERRIVMLLVPFSTVMSTVGVLFMYLLMLPVCLWFFMEFSTGFPEASSAESPLFKWIFRVPTTVSEVDPNATPIAKIPVLDVDPPTPQEGQLWLKPNGSLRIFVNNRVGSIPLTSTSFMTPWIEIHEYFNFVLALTLGIVIAFQLPVVMLVLGWTGLVDPAVLSRYRRHCILACFCLGMILTPSDVLSMILLAVPLWLLFEFGLLLMRQAFRRTINANGEGDNTDA